MLLTMRVIMSFPFTSSISRNDIDPSTNSLSNIILTSQYCTGILDKYNSNKITFDSTEETVKDLIELAKERPQSLKIVLHSGIYNSLRYYYRFFTFLITPHDTWGLWNRWMKYYDHHALNEYSYDDFRTNFYDFDQNESFLSLLPTNWLNLHRGMVPSPVSHNNDNDDDDDDADFNLDNKINPEYTLGLLRHDNTKPAFLIEDVDFMYRNGIQPQDDKVINKLIAVLNFFEAEINHTDVIIVEDNIEPIIDPNNIPLNNNSTNSTDPTDPTDLINFVDNEVDSDLELIIADPLALKFLDYKRQLYSNKKQYKDNNDLNDQIAPQKPPQPPNMSDFETSTLVTYLENYPRSYLPPQIAIRYWTFTDSLIVLYMLARLQVMVVQICLRIFYLLMFIPLGSWNIVSTASQAQIQTIGRDMFTSRWYNYHLSWGNFGQIVFTRSLPLVFTPMAFKPVLSYLSTAVTLLTIHFCVTTLIAVNESEGLMRSYYLTVDRNAFEYAVESQASTYEVEELSVRSKYGYLLIFKEVLLTFSEQSLVKKIIGTNYRIGKLNDGKISTQCGGNHNEIENNGVIVTIDHSMTNLVQNDSDNNDEFGLYGEGTEMGLYGEDLIIHEDHFVVTKDNEMDSSPLDLQNNNLQTGNNTIKLPNDEILSPLNENKYDSNSNIISHNGHGCNTIHNDQSCDDINTTNIQHNSLIPTPPQKTHSIPSPLHQHPHPTFLNIIPYYKPTEYIKQTVLNQFFIPLPLNNDEIETVLNNDQNNSNIVNNQPILSPQIEIGNDNNKNKNDKNDKNLLQNIQNGQKSTHNVLNLLLNIKSEACNICLVEFEYHDRCILLPCSHMYHESCAKQWFTKKGACPLCLKPLKRMNKTILTKCLKPMLEIDFLQHLFQNNFFPPKINNDQDEEYNGDLGVGGDTNHLYFDNKEEYSYYNDRTEDQCYPLLDKLPFDYYQKVKKRNQKITIIHNNNVEPNQDNITPIDKSIDRSNSDDWEHVNVDTDTDTGIIHRDESDSQNEVKQNEQHDSSKCNDPLDTVIPNDETVQNAGNEEISNNVQFGEIDVTNHEHIGIIVSTVAKFFVRKSMLDFRND
jgi:hypothetical protein